MKTTFTIIIERPKQRLRWAPATKTRPGKTKDTRRGGGKWQPRGDE